MVQFYTDKQMVKWWGKQIVRGLTAAKFLFHKTCLDLFSLWAHSL